jgi:integrase/recombinase XerC
MTQELILQDNRAVVAGNLNNWLDRFFMFIDVKAKSADTYKKATKQFMKYLAENGITEPTRDTIISWREYLRAEHKPTTIQLYLTAVKLFFSWLEQEGVYKNIANKVKGIRIEKGHKKDYLTSKQSKEVLDDIDTTTAKGKRDFAIVALLLTTGLRTIEVVRADVADLRTVADSTVLFIQGKGKDEKNDYVKVAPQVEKALREYLKTRDSLNDNEPLFTSTSNENKGERLTTRTISKIAKTSLVNAGLNSDRLTAHSFRHTAGTLALLNGAELTQVKELLRHEQIQTTLIYTHNIDRAKNNSEALVANAIFSME